MNKTKKYKVDNLSQSFMKLVQEGSPHKNQFMTHWATMYREYYMPLNQYGKCEDNGNYGVLDKNGKWSYLNLFNTNYSVNTYLCNYINKRIKNDLISKGILSISNVPVTLIKFENNGFLSETKFLEQEMERYFTWVRIFAKDIFVSLNDVKSGMILHDLINVSKTTFFNGTYCEIVLQYYTMKWDSSITAKRTSVIRGSSDDFSGKDLYVLDRNGNELYHIQSKMTGIYKNSIRKLDNKRYTDNGVKYMGLVDLFSTYKKRVVVLNLSSDLFFVNDEGKFEYTDDKVHNQTVMDNFFSPDNAFYNFFLYCSKKDITFDLEKNEDNQMNIKYHSSDNRVSAILPSDEKHLDTKMILDVWEQMIYLLDTDEVKDNNLEELKKFVK